MTATVFASATPVPDIVTLGAAPGALLVTVSVPLAAPAFAGVNVTETVHVLPLGPGAKVEGLSGQLLATTNAVLDEVILEIVTGEFPVLVKVMVCGFGWFAVLPTDSVGKTIVFRSISRPCAAVNPLPEREIVLGLPGALSTMVTVAVRVPAAVGVNVTPAEQLAPILVDGAIGHELLKR